MENEKATQLIDFLAQTSEKHLRVEEDFGDGYVRLNVDEASKRQAKHDIRCVEDALIEMLRNSRDAGAKNIIIASWRNENRIRKIVVIDDGVGIPPLMQDKIFQARVTSKLDKYFTDDYGVHGRGMALFSISQNADIQIINSASKRGTVIKFSADTGELRELCDQSTMPKIKESKDVIEIQGPNNILKTAIEFNLKNPELSVYYGSPSEIASLLFLLGSMTFSQADPFNNSYRKYLECLCFISSAEELKETLSSQYGLEVSVRNCHRILSNQIKPPVNMADFIIKSVKNKSRSLNRTLTSYLSEDDLAQISDGVAKLFREVADKYFVRLHTKPKIVRRNNKIDIVLMLDKVDEIY